jgi:hypothetical protein
MTAARIRRHPHLVTRLQGPLGDLLTALAADARREVGAGEQTLLDEIFWATRNPGGAGARRYDYRSAGLSSAARIIATLRPPKGESWLEVAVAATEALRAFAGAHDLAGRRRQAEQALAVATRLETAATNARHGHPPGSSFEPNKAIPDVSGHPSPIRYARSHS